MRYIIVLIIIGIFLVSITGCVQPTQQDSGKIKMVTTFYPLYEFSQRIGGDRVEVSIMVPAGVEPHEWEPGPRDIINIQSARIFVYNGAGFEPWVEETLKGVDPEKLVVVDFTKGIELLKEEGEALDPHIWLDPVFVKNQVYLIEEALIKSDPENETYYKANAQTLREELTKLDEEIRTELVTTKKKVFIASHAAFSYYAKRYGLKQIAITGLSPEAEPSPAKIVEIVKIAKENEVKYIFFETLVSPRLSEVIAKEVGAKTLVLNPIEGLSQAEMDEGKTYFTVMRDNLKNLKLALDE
ncbi:MAG: metal ABC transporter substrate-binding protein [Candidatus Methanoperedens sp.]|nr:metal ABC transporter substrate-binding protein [Candidatus Methanoperedens sp.]